MIGRRAVMAAAASLAAPRIAGAGAARTLKFVPQADLAVLDPIYTTSTITRSHGYMILDTLYGLDDAAKPQPQMAAGHTTEQDGLVWTIFLRDGLRFHDNTQVLARDAVASLKRWWIRDTFGSVLRAATDELVAVDDTSLRFRLKKTFPMLPDALAKATTYEPFIMPAWQAATPPNKPVANIVGSGPYRYRPGDAVPGAEYAWERFAGYVPRPGGVTSFTSGPKTAWFDRVEWHIIPDPATAAAALRNGEVDWWEQPSIDLQPMLRSRPDLKVTVPDPNGFIAAIKMNCLNPPFDNAAIRRVILDATNQRDYMISIVGDDPQLFNDRIGVFTPGCAMASDVGTERFVRPVDIAAARRGLVEAGYHGETVVVLLAADNPISSAPTEICIDLLKKIGMNVDVQSSDWGTLQARRVNMGLPAQGGWSLFISSTIGLEQLNPASHQFIRGNGRDSFFGWPTSPRLEELRFAWFDAPDLATQKEICRQMQMQAWVDVPYVPLGQYLQATAFRADLTGMLSGFPKFYNIRRTG
jgi:peptide/nickel transport system substrate-binding protein